MNTPSLHLDHDISCQTLKVQHHGRLIWQYRYAGTPKPHVHPFATPAGESASLAAPHDHVHHRGLQLAWRVNGINFWEESPAESGDVNGRICHESWEQIATNCTAIKLVQRLQWQDASGQSVLSERRTLEIGLEAGHSAVRCLWKSQFFSPSGEARISGYTPHSKISYYGLGFRFARALDHGGKHLDSEGRTGQPEENGLPARWHYYHGHLDETGTAVGVLMGDCPQNPRYPTPWFHISHPPAPFAYVTASFIAHDEFLLQAGKTLELTYAVWVHEGAWDANTCNQIWKKTFSL